MLVSPAQWVIQQFGGVRKTAYACQVSPSTICRLRRSKSRRGAGGHISSPELLKRILELAKERGLDVTPTDLVLGREVTGLQ